MYISVCIICFQSLAVSILGKIILNPKDITQEDLVIPRPGNELFTYLALCFRSLHIF